MLFNEYFNTITNTNLQETTWWGPDHIGDTLIVKDGAGGILKKYVGMTFTKIDPSDASSEYTELVGGGKGSNESFFVGSDGITYKFVNVGNQGKMMWVAKGGKKTTSGAATTRLQEGATAQFLALAINDRKFALGKNIMELFETNSVDDITDLIAAAQENFITDATPKEVVEFLATNKKWLESTASTVETIMKEFTLKGSDVIHHASNLVKTLESKAVELLISSGAKISRDKKDKWCPADIWVIKKTAPDIKSAINASSIDELNSFVNKNIDKKQIKQFGGISLKQAKLPSAKIEYFNMDQDATINRITADEVATAINLRDGISKGTQISDTDNHIAIQFRNTKGRKFTTNLSGLIKGKLAQGGSVTINQIWKYLKQPIPKYPTEISYWLNDDSTPTEEAYKVYQQHVNDAIANLKRINITNYRGFLWSLKTKKDFDKFVEATIKANKNDLEMVAISLHSKIQGLLLLSKITEETFDYVYNQASARSEISPRFVKIGG